MDLSKKFVSQEEIDNVKKKRQEEWEKKRTPDQPLECPEEEIDNRSLYDKLEEQKLRKKEEEEEKYRLKNCVKGLADDEVTFLDFVSQRQIALEKQRNSEEANILQEMRESSVNVVTAAKTSENKPSKPQVSPTSKKRSQQALLAGAVKRKSTESSDDSKKLKLSQKDQNSSTNSEEERLPTHSDNRKSESVTDNVSQNTVHTASGNKAAIIAGVLPGLGAYDNDTSDSATSSSDSETEFKINEKFS